MQSNKEEMHLLVSLWKGHPKRFYLSVLIILGTILLCLATYFSLPMEYRWAVNSVIEVPVCTSRIAKKLETKAEFNVVKEYIIQSLQLGMTPNEVEMTLKQFGPIEISGTYFNDEQEMGEVILIRLCENPFGNIVLFVVYSKDNRLINVVDAYED